MILTFNRWFIDGSIPSNRITVLVNHSTALTCEGMYNRTKTLEEIIQLLKQQPCIQIFETATETRAHHSKRQRRNTDASGNIDVRALQTTINDHRTMINYLVNNSINATYVTEAIRDHHSSAGPILSSWRDLIDLFTLSFFIFCFIYYCICRTGISPCDKMIAVCCRPIITRTASTHNRNKSELQAPIKTPRKSIKKRPIHSSVASIEGDIARFCNGYTSE